LVPARLMETRSGPGMLTVDHLYQGTGAIAAGIITSLQVAGRGGVATDATSAVLNVTVTEPAGNGYLTVYPCDQPRPLASNVNFTTGATVANAVIAKLAANGTTCLYSSTTVHIVVDTNGYMPAGSSGVLGLVPARLMETRSGPGMLTVDHLYQGTGAIAAGIITGLQVAGRGGVATDATSAVLNVTVTEPAGNGYLTVYPCDQPRPLASNVNFTTGATVANAVIAKLAANGTTCLYSSATTHIVIDTNAYMP
jgi:hypothetical protein